MENNVRWSVILLAVARSVTFAGKMNMAWFFFSCDSYLDGLDEENTYRLSNQPS